VHLQAFAKEGLAIMSVLEAEGVPPDRIYLGHMNASVGDVAYQRDLLDRGVFLGFDFFGMDHSEFAYGKIPADPPGHYLPTDYDACLAIARFVREGYVRQILVSHDIGERIRLQVYAGWGFGHVTGHIVPLLLALGLDQADIDTILVDNPRRLLTIQAA
jgi:phosphotriesterase-related protein